MTDRMISENALLVLLTGKITALHDKIERLNAKENPTPRDLRQYDEANAKCDVLNVVIGHLRFIPDANGETAEIVTDGAESAMCPFTGGTEYRRGSEFTNGAHAAAPGKYR